MDLKELESTVLEQATKTKELRSEEDKLKSEICNTIANNLKEIVIPCVVQMNTFLEKLRNLTSSLPEKEERFVTIPLGDVDGSYEFRLRVSYRYGINLNYKCHGYSSWSKYLEYADDFKEVYRWLSQYALRNIFLNEEESMKVVDLIQQQYADILGVWAEHTKSCNEALSESIETMRDILSNAHCVSHKEDGTVEIHLGDKVYRGTLIED